MGNLLRFTVLILAAASLGLVGCAPSEIQVGAVISETGAASVYGDDVKRGLDLALAEINDAGGLDGTPITLTYRDDETNPDKGVQVVQELIDEVGAKVIIGAVSSRVTLAIGPICQEKGVVMLSPTASAPEISELGEYVYRNYPSDIVEATAMADFARDLGLENVAVFSVNDEYGRGHRDVFTEKYPSTYRKIVGEDKFVFEEGQTDAFQAMVDEIKEQDLDGIYAIGYLEDIAELLKVVRGAGLGAVVLTSSSVTNDLVTLAGEASENLVFPRPTTFDPDSDDAAVKNFVDAYQAKYGEEPEAFAAYGYDALKIIYAAMVQGGSAHPSDLKIGLANLEDYKGPTGRVAFDRNGDVVQYPRLYIIREGNAVAYDDFIEGGGSLEIPGQR
jgi:branched-chain amino acid transport system substrate-binding protein